MKRRGKASTQQTRIERLYKGQSWPLDLDSVNEKFFEEAVIYSITTYHEFLVTLAQYLKRFFKEKYSFR